MQILFSLVLLALISCGGGSGGSGSGSSPGNITPPTACTGTTCDNLKRFQAIVANNQWGAYPTGVSINYKFYYYDPKSNSGCKEMPLGIFTFNYCLRQEAPTLAHTTNVINGVVSNPLVPLATIQNIVRNAELWTNITVRDQSKAYANFDNQQWIIVLGSEIFVFNPNLPLGVNPTYYKDKTGKEFSYSYYYEHINP